MLARRAQVHQSQLVSHLTPLDPTYMASLSGASHFLMTQGSNPVQALNQAHGLIYGNLIRQANMLAYTDSFWLLGLTFLAMVPFMFLMKKTKPKRASAAPVH
jgi:DHA2 family multidrug resistance protein